MITAENIYYTFEVANDTTRVQLLTLLEIACFAWLYERSFTIPLCSHLNNIFLIHFVDLTY
jgi:hypothetical protein